MALSSSVCKSFAVAFAWTTLVCCQAISFFTHRTAKPKKIAEISNRLVAPKWIANAAVNTGPMSAPVVPPAAMNPNNRFACAELNVSTIKLQNTETMNKLNTLAQIKNARAT